MGAELFSEGPISSKASYLINYRYSTLALIEKMGIDIKGLEAPVFHDLNYKLNFKLKRAGELNLFGVNGWSTVGKEKTGQGSNGNRQVNKREDFQFGHVFNGLSYQVALNEETSFKIATGVLNTQFKSVNQLRDSTGSFFTKSNEAYDKLVLKSHAYFQNKWKTVELKSGILFNQLFFDLSNERKSDSVTVSSTKVSEEGQTRYYQAYSSIKWHPHKKVFLTGGLHALIFELNGNFSIEPRFAFQWRPTKKHTLSYGTGLYSKLENMITYWVRSEDSLGNVQQYNLDLDLMKSVHNVLSYSFTPNEGIEFSVEAYHQYLFNVPVTDTSNNGGRRNLYSAINDKGLVGKGKLISDGVGWNYGGDFSFSVFTKTKFVGKATFSVYNSKYRGSDGVTRNTLWNNNFSLNLIAGKEFKIGKEKKASLQIGANTNLAGGKRYAVIDEAASYEVGEKIYDLDASYKDKGPIYYRIDMLLAYTKQLPRTNVSLRLDVQNVTNRTYLVDQDFDVETGITDDRRGQLLPVLSASFDFEWEKKK